MRRKKWFKTLKEAKEFQKLWEKENWSEFRIFKWRHTKRAKPFFVGDHIEWLNIG